MGGSGAGISIKHDGRSAPELLHLPSAVAEAAYPSSMTGAAHLRCYTYPQRRRCRRSPITCEMSAAMAVLNMKKPKIRFTSKLNNDAM